MAENKRPMGPGGHHGPVGPEGGGVEHLAARVHIGALEAEKHLRVGEDPPLRGYPPGHPGGEEVRPGGSVQEQGLFGQFLKLAFRHGVLASSARRLSVVME